MASSLWHNRSHKGGTSVTLPESNYSQAFGFALQNPGQFQGSNDNYNCYHFAINGAWEKEIFQPTLVNKLFGKSDGVPRLIDMEGATNILQTYFEPGDVSSAVFGESLVGANYQRDKFADSPQHVMVFAGQGQDGTIYVLHKPGVAAPPTISPMTEATGSKYHQDFRFYNEK